MTPLLLAMISRLAAAGGAAWDWAREHLGMAVAQPEIQTPELRDVAQLQDHCPDAARTLDRGAKAPKAIAQKSKVPREGRSGASPPDLDGFRVLMGPRIDGGTCWAIRPRPGRSWSIFGHLHAVANRGATSIELPDEHGEVVTMTLERARGEVVLRTGRLRLAVRRKRAEVSITAEAAEVEGVASWYARELPRVAWWLLGVSGLPEDELPDALAIMGVRQKRIELCLDCVGLEIHPGTNDRLISLAAVSAHQRRSGELDHVGAGSRSSTPCSLSIYDKLAELGRQRGVDHAALLARMEAAGLGEGEAWTRIELRCWGAALLLEGLDATHPGAALDDELLGRLWSDGLTRHWLAAPSARFLGRRREWEDAGREGSGPRMRDEQVDPRWVAARAAGATAEPLRLSRDVAARQRQAVTDHARARLHQAAADTERLLDGTGSGLAAIGDLEAAIAGDGWSTLLARADARYADVIRQSGGDS